SNVVDRSATLLLDHFPSSIPGEVKQRNQVEFKDITKVIKTFIDCRSWSTVAGVVYENVKAPEAFDGEPRHLLALSLVSQVGGKRHDPGTSFRQPLEPLRSASDSHDVTSTRCKHLRDPVSKAAGSTRHDCNAACHAKQLLKTHLAFL